MGELRDRAYGRDPSVTKGKVKTTFKRVEGCKKLDQTRQESSEYLYVEHRKRDL